jgi:hypothetical protein
MTASTGDVPGRIFMSYRREDTAFPAGWLYDRLVSHFGREQVFKDIDSIELGDDFIEVITTAVGSCDVLLALIGGRWLTITGQDGRRRLDNPDDFVRLEIEAALARYVRVIPILVDVAQMPRADELPPSLAKLARRQALELSPNRFDTDTRRLLRVLDRTVAEAQEQARHDAEEAVARQRQVEQLQGQLRERAGVQDWQAVVAASQELAALDPAAADPDGLASAAREQITRRQEAEEQARQEAEEQARQEAEELGEAATPSQVGEDATSISATTLTSVAEAPEHALETGAAEHEAAAHMSALSAAPGMPDATEDDSRTVATAATAALTGQAKPRIPPRLELSATVIDFGQVTLNSESPEHKIRLSNTGGGSLDLRSTAQADWLRLRQDGDDLVVSVDTGAPGEHEGAITVDSNGGSAAIRVQARVVCSEVSTKEDTGTPSEGISAKTPDESAASTITTTAEPSQAAGASVKETPEHREQAGAGNSPRIPAAGSAMQETKIPSDRSETPARQPRGLSRRARILVGAGVGIVSVAIILIAVLIPVLGSSHTTSPPAQAGNPTSSPGGTGNPAPSTGWPFREDFSTTANGWITAGSTGGYSNGTYQISVPPNDAWGLAAPTNVPELNPAPQNITIKVSARQIAGGDNTFYGVACRTEESGQNGYMFNINDNGSVFIDKWVGGIDDNIAQSFSALVPNGTNQLQVACTSVGGQNAVHLVLWVNGTMVLDATDRKNPFTGGTVGLFVASASNSETVKAEFDNFVVTRT